MPTNYERRDARFAALDLAELGKRLKHRPLPPPAEARPSDRPGRPGARIVLPWLYDLDYGWTPKREAKDPRPPLNLPPYYRERFMFRTGGLKAADHSCILIDLRSFPRASRVFVWLPAKALRRARYNALRRGVIHAPDGSWATVPATPKDYNRLFGEKELATATPERVLVELAPHRRAVLDQLQLGAEPVLLEVRYAVSRKSVRPKSQSVIHFGQLIDGFLVGEFEHVFQAYHPFDIPIVGDQRTKLAYRRSSREVSTIPPLALVFFDSWAYAAACGYDPAPRSFAKHFRPRDVSDALKARILEFLNAPETDSARLRRRVTDNAFVDTRGAEEPVARKKRGLGSAVATRILATRDRLPEQRFTGLEQVDAVLGVGPDTLSDLITSFLTVRGDDDRWYPDEDVMALLDG